MTYVLSSYLLQVAVDDFNSTIASLGDAISISHWSNGGREWEFDCRVPPTTLMAQAEALAVAMRAAPGRTVLLDRGSKRLVIR